MNDFGPFDLPTVSNLLLLPPQLQSPSSPSSESIEERIASSVENDIEQEPHEKSPVRRQSRQKVDGGNPLR